MAAAAAREVDRIRAHRRRRLSTTRAMTTRMMTPMTKTTSTHTHASTARDRTRNARGSRETSFGATSARLVARADANGDRGRPRARVRARAQKEMQELCKAEIPPHIPRADFVKQMYRWCASEYEQGGLSSYGKRMSVECVNEMKDGNTNGVMVRIYDYKDGKEVEIGSMIAQMDEEKVQTWDTIVPTKDGGIEKLNRDGKDKFIEGRFFVVSRPLPADETANPALKKMIKRLTLAINAYYSFGSPFSEEF